MPPVNSTKSLTGHSLGAAGVHEAIYSILQMQNGFIAESANIEELDPEVADAPIVRLRGVVAAAGWARVAHVGPRGVRSSEGGQNPDWPR